MANMKFYFTPGSCSIGIHILLEELEQVFEAYLINLLQGDNLSESYLAINPRGTIPALVLKDGTALTDFICIAQWLAEAFPRKRLLPENPRQRQEIEEVLRFAVEVVHGQGFTRIFTTDKYATESEAQQAIIDDGRAIVIDGLNAINEKFANGKLSLSDFTIADAALFYIEFWADRIGLELPPFCQQHYRQMLLRPAVRQVLMEEGYYSVLKSADQKEAVEA